MNKNERDQLAAFVSQRMEMGERDWHVDPDAVRTVLNADVAGTDAVPVASAGQNAVPSAQNVPANEAGMFDTQDIAAGQTLATLEKTVSGCMRCPLGKTRNKMVFGAGDPNAGIMFIGEAPGADEDAQGIPFIGRAGKLLTSMIEAMKLTRDEVFIGNILKCRPPNNRDPKSEEIEQCEPILLRQIELIKPQVICALGRISGQTLLRTKATLASLRGVVHDYHGVKFIVTYHPAALLRNPNWKRPAWDDLKMVRREYDGLEL